MKIYLIGMPGSGKSTVGKIISQNLNYQFMDMDVEIERETGKSIKQIFKEDGEKHFRFMESQLLKMVAEKDMIVVATGGGVPAHNENMQVIKSSGVSFYLETPMEILISNNQNESTSRPLLVGKDLATTLKNLLSERESFYLMADHIIKSRNTPGESAQEIISLIRN